MYKKCLICGQDSKALVLNNLKMRKCRSCDLIWRQNFDISDSDYQENKIDLSQEKIRIRTLNSKDRINILKKYTELNNLCDIGCGEGIFLKTLQEKGYKNVIGIEPNLRFLNFAKKNNLKVFNGTIKNLPELIRNNNIHTVTMFHLIEHLENPKEALKLIYDNIKKGDKLIIETPNINGYSLKKTDYRHELICPQHLFYFNIANLGELLRKIGFKTVIYGKRDFNQRNLDIREFLFRLGFLPPKRHRKIKSSESKSKTKKTKDYFRSFIRKVLSKIVILSGRLNHMWIIVEKP